MQNLNAAWCWTPSASSEHKERNAVATPHSSTIAHTHNLSLSSISINITSYSSPSPLTCSCFSKCSCKSPLQFLQWLLHAWRGSVPRGECLNSSLWTRHETRHSRQCLVMLSFRFCVLQNASHQPGKMNWVGTFPFELPYSNYELIRDYSGITHTLLTSKVSPTVFKIMCFYTPPQLPLLQLIE